MPVIISGPPTESSVLDDLPSLGESRSQPRMRDPKDRVRVLVVDDDERNLFAIQTVLDDVADTVLARSGEEALRFLLREEFAVILLDVYMPGMDGYETAQIIRQREQSKRIPIIFLTAVNKEDSHMLRGYAMGAVDYVFKPFEPLILKSKVAVFVDLFDKTREIQRKAALEQRLLDENLRVDTEKLLAEQALRRAEERQAIVLKSLPIALYRADIDAASHHPQFVSGNLAALTGGFSPESWSDHIDSWPERVHPEDRGRVARGFARLRETGSIALEYRWRGADDQSRSYLDQAVVLRDSDGTAKEVVGTVLDVTERRQLESQLVQAQKMDAIGKLTGGIAHDFNNLLASVMGGIDLIARRGGLNQEGSQLLDMTRRATEQGAELVRRLLAFSRRQQLQPSVIRLTKLFRSLDHLVAHTLGGLIRFDWRIDDRLWAALADEAQLELALMNLIINARDAMSEGGTITVNGENRVVELEDESGLSPGSYVVITVSDTGIGMTPEVMALAFEPFFTTKDTGKGTGLGLSMVYGFARQSGGTVRMDSRVGIGTRVEIWLPRAPAEMMEEVDDAAPAAPQARSPRGTRRQVRVLLVDDDHAVRETTTALLEDLGHRVTAAMGGAEALSLVERDPDAFDLIITDYAMPVVSGLDVIRLARNIRPSLPALVVTGYADTTAIDSRPSDVAMLNKPFPPVQLSDAIERALGS